MHCASARRERHEGEETARLLREHDEIKTQWERERAEDIENGIARQSDWLQEVQSAVPAREVRTNLIGWTADDLRSAADALDAGREVLIPVRDPRDIAKKAIEDFGITPEMIAQAKARILGEGKAA